jgi:hypothetical protein
MNTRAKGDKLERKVANLLDLETTAKSGGHWDNADLTTRDPNHPLRDFVIECKYKDIPWLRPVRSEIEKVQAQAKKGFKDFIYIQENQAGDFVIMSLDALASLIEKIKQ